MKYQPKKRRAKVKVDLKTAEIVKSTTSPRSINTAIAPPKSTTKSSPQAPAEAAPEKSRHILVKTRYVAIFIIVLFAGVFFGRVAIWEDQYLAAKEGSERSQVETENSTTTADDDVDTTEPSEIEIAEYHVSPPATLPHHPLPWHL